MKKTICTLLILLIVALLLCFVACQPKISIEQYYEQKDTLQLSLSFLKKVGLSDGTARLWDLENDNIIRYPEFLEMYEEYNAVRIIATPYTESGETKWQSLVIEFKSSKDAMRYHDSIPTTSSSRIVKDNVVFMDINYADMLLDSDYTVTNDMAISSDGSTLLYNMQNIDDYKIPENITKISGLAFVGSSLQVLRCNDELQEIGFAAFANCDNLTNIVLNDGLKLIESTAFFGASLSYVIIPDSVEYVGHGAFTDTIVFCEAKSKPSGWHKDFAYDCTIYWGDEWEIKDNIISPTSNKK